MKLIAAKPVAFGNGTRPLGFEFGDLKLSDGQKLFHLHQKAMGMKVKELGLESCNLTEGVSEKEFCQALLNLGTAARLEEVKPPIKPEIKANEGDGKTSPSGANWLDALIAESKLTDAIKAKLAEAELETFEQLKSHADENNGFGKLGLTKTQIESLMKELQRLNNAE